MTQVIIITGTRKGIGKDLATYYLSLGHIVIGCSRKKGTIIQKRYTHYILDVADEKAVIFMVRQIRKNHKKIDVLINNAGIASMNHVLSTPIETVKKIFSTNVYGSFLFLREVAKLMRKEKYGRIVNFSTVAVPLHLPGEAIYAASKAAIISLTKIAAKELADFGITVNAIGPTPIVTDLIRNVPKEKINDLLDKQTIKRFGEFDDIRSVIDFFIDKRNNFITGQVIYLGGIS